MQNLKEIRKILGITLVISTIAFALIAILSIWSVFNTETTWKAVSTLGVIFLASFIFLFVLKIIEDGQEKK